VDLAHGTSFQVSTDLIPEMSALSELFCVWPHWRPIDSNQSDTMELDRDNNNNNNNNNNKL